MKIRKGLIEKYDRSIEVALDERRADDAIADGRYLIWLEPSNDRFRFALAKAYELGGDDEQAAALLEELAPEDHVRYLPAHVARIRRDVQRSNVSASRLERIDHEIDRLAEAGLDPDERGELRVRLWLRTGRIDDALKALEANSQATPELRLSAAEMFASLDLAKPARRQAKLAQEAFATRMSMREDVADRLRWAQATAIAGDIDAAAEILRKGMVLHPRSTFSLELARLHLQSALIAPVADTQRREALLRATAGLLSAIEQPTAESYFMLYQLHLARGNTDRAFDALSRAVAIDRSRLLELARFQASRGGVENARQIALKVRNDCTAELANQPFERRFRLLGAEAYVLLREYADAATMLNAAYEAIHDPAYSTSLGHVYLAWWDSKAASESTTAEIELLERASDYFPTSLELVRRCANVRKRLQPSDTATMASLDRIEQRYRQALHSFDANN
ncbi:MAG TPA: hypothetical protein VG713_05840 [Pirellulales bacterium]|nr:hypothetical protein [Pirellulales bacterium]